jgi:hypothetical protein
VELGGKVSCRSTAERTTKDDYVFLPKLGLFDHKLIRKFGIVVNLLLSWTFRVIIDSITWVFDCKHIDFKGRSHVVKHLIRNANVLSIPVEEDYQFSAAFQVG